MRRLRTAIIGFGSSLILALSSCGGEVGGRLESETSRLVSKASVPAQVSVRVGDEFKIGGEGFEMGDVIAFIGGKTISREVSVARYNHAIVTISEEFTDGHYDVELRRGKESQDLGKTSIMVQSGDRYNVTGKVLCEGSPLPGVRVSDGKAWGETDEKGEYRFFSDKTRGLVFIIIPSGFFPEVTRGFPSFWKSFSSKDVSTIETADFHLFKEANDNHRMVFTADWHLAGRLDDINVWSKTYKAEMDSFDASSKVPVYEIALGDITWDSFWYNGGPVPSVWKNLNSTSKHPIFTVMGNHDYDLKVYGTKDDDLEASSQYRKALGPDYFSMDIGKIHYIIVDDIVYANSNGTADGRDPSATVSKEQMEWIKEDLSHVSKSTPVVIAAHAPFYRTNPSSGRWVLAPVVTNGSAFLSLFSEFKDVTIFCGHQHVHQYKDFQDAGLSFAKNKMVEHTVPPIGGTLWTTQHYVGFDVGTDGCPPGYDWIDVAGTSFETRFKAIGEDDDHQMRLYDLNRVKAFWDSDPDVAKLVSYKAANSFDKRFGAYVENSILINVFFGDPDLKNMCLEVTEDGKPLKVENVAVYDPLHVAAYEVACYKKEGKINTAYQSVVSSHIFKAVASKATSTITVKVTDKQGRTITETMRRPKDFNTKTNH